jgi:hypothetical protein
VQAIEQPFLYAVEQNMGEVLFTGYIRDLYTKMTHFVLQVRREGRVGETREINEVWMGWG